MLSSCQNLPQCPRCDTALEPLALHCPNCEYKEIENIDFLDVSDQREYKERLQFQRAAWVQFDKALQEKLAEFGEAWARLETWNKLWQHIEPMADAVGFTKRATNQRAGKVVSRKVSIEKEKNPRVSPHLEVVRNWVAALPDGEVNVVSWERLLQSLDEPVNDALLEDFRDAEIARQFAQFETASVDSLGQLQAGGRRRVKRLVENLGDGCELVMLYVPGGEFQMGSARYRWERPVHSVSVPSFYLGQFSVTQAQWRAVVRLPKVDLDLREHCSSFAGDNLPVDSVSWVEAAEFCARLAKQTGKQYRLPSEAEWEYACRAGSREDFAFGPSITPVIVNFDGTHPFGCASVGICRKGTVPVGSLGAANNFGLYDMHGNLCEWCEDEWHQNYDEAPQNGLAWISGNGVTQRVTRGGSWTNTAEICRSSDRSRELSDLKTKLHYMGFRVATNL
jgi:formylglycine-generating enzyme required for sulfatase activity